MKKQMILSSLFFVTGLFLSSVQGADSDEPKICPNPNSPNEALEVGYTCKVPTTVETRYSDEDPNGKDYAEWTLVKKEGSREVWAARTPKRGPIYVGPIEEGYYNFNQAEEVCNRTEEIVFDGETRQIKMTVPEIGFGRVLDIDNNLLNFEFMKYLNYTSVIPDKVREWFWAAPITKDKSAWSFRPVNDNFNYDYRSNLHSSVRCVGRQVQDK